MCYQVGVTSRPDSTGRRNPEPRKDLVERATPFLPGGSVVRQAFIYQTAPSFGFFMLTYVAGITAWNKYRCVAVTDDAIHVLESTKSSGGARPERLLGTLPRRTRLGPASGRWAQLSILGERCWVHTRFHDQIAAADRDAGFTD
jgi:hypothetical protein